MVTSLFNRARRASAAMVSSELRFRELRRFLDQHPEA